jgi:hypothetical protein
MKFKIKQITKVLFYVISVAYPGVVFYFLVIRKIPLRQLSLFVIAFALLAFIYGTSGGSSKKKLHRTLVRRTLVRGLGPQSLLYGPACFS